MRRNENLIHVVSPMSIITQTHTLRSAPALELNLVAVTTLRFLGSTAPTATSGVSTTATSLGGAVKIAARPNNTENPLAAPFNVEVVEAAKLPAGVPDRVNVGLWVNAPPPIDARPPPPYPKLVLRLNRPFVLPATLPPDTDGARAMEWRGRPVPRLRLAERRGDCEMALGGALLVGVGDGFPSSSSCHCK